MKKLLLLSLFSILLTNISYSQGTTCPTADPFCTGTTYTFPNNTGVADAGTFDCLFTTPNPAWYYLQIANSGSLTIDISQTDNNGLGIDVDFAIWGPFTSTSDACATNLAATSAVDCSYSTAAVETCVIPNAVAGEWYMLLLTNFADDPGTIEFSQTGGTGTTDCSVLCNAPAVTVGAIQTITCTNTTVSLSASSSVSGVTYSWTGPGGFTSGSPTPAATIAGTYTVTVTDPANSGCPATATQVVNSDTTAPIAVAGNDVMLACNASSLNLNGAGSSTGAGMTYSWSTSNGSITGGANTLTPSVSQVGSYTVTVTNTANGCTASDVVDVTLEPFPVASFNANPPSGTAPLTVNFTNTSSNSTNYAWSFDNGQTSILNDPSTVYSTPGVYTVILVATNASGCADTATIIITVDELSNLVIPNVFTPNGDGSNDYFKPVLAKGLKAFKMLVYDRWGLKMSEVTNESLGWDGNSKNGSVAPDGTYYYIVDAKGADGIEYKFTGYVSLIRAK